MNGKPTIFPRDSNSRLLPLVAGTRYPPAAVSQTYLRNVLQNSSLQVLRRPENDSIKLRRRADRSTTSLIRNYAINSCCMNV